MTDNRYPGGRPLRPQIRKSLSIVRIPQVLTPRLNQTNRIEAVGFHRIQDNGIAYGPWTKRK